MSKLVYTNIGFKEKAQKQQARGTDRGRDKTANPNENSGLTAAMMKKINTKLNKKIYEYFEFKKEFITAVITDLLFYEDPVLNTTAFEIYFRINEIDIYFI